MGLLDRFKKKAHNQHKIVSLPDSDPYIKAYQELAQEELPYLIDFIKEHPDETGELFRYAVKKRFIEGEEAEHMWVQVYSYSEDQFRGRLANEPNTVQHIKYGEYTNVHKDEVEDWVLEDFLTNTKVGHFSKPYVTNNTEDN